MLTYKDTILKILFQDNISKSCVLQIAIAIYIMTSINTIRTPFTSSLELLTDNHKTQLCKCTLLS